MKEWIQGDERIDQLIGHELKIIQSPSVFSFSLDAVLLGNFAQVPKHNRAKIIDLCAGNGVVGLLLSKKTNSSIVGVELQPRLVNMAERSIQMNHLEEQLSVVEGNINDLLKWIKKDSVDIVTCNPPYFANEGTSIKNPNSHMAIARHELHTNLDELMRVTSGLLKMNGKAYFVHRPDRLLEILDAMKRHRLAPKKIRFIYPKENKEANTLLIEAIKDGKDTGFRILPPLVVYSQDNQYMPEVKEMLYGKNN